MRRPPVVGAILAGGRSSRMGGGDKCLLPLGGRALLSHVIERLRPQVDGLVLSANGDPARFAGFGLPVVPDTQPDWPGPLAGMLAGVMWVRANRPEVAHVATAAADTPFLPADLVERLASAPAGTIGVARSGGRVHPVFALMPVTCAEDLDAYLASGGRRVTDWLARFPVTPIDFDDGDPFFNVNVPADLEAAEARLAGAAPIGR